MLTFLQNGVIITLSQERALRRILMIVILGTMVLTLVMLGINAAGFKEVNYAFTVIGLILLLGKGTKPEAIGLAAVTGFVWGISQWQNPIRGAATGIETWIIRGLPAVITFWMCLSGFLATWSFEQNPGAFFPIAIFGGILFFATTAFNKWEGDFMYPIIVWYSGAVIILALLASAGIRPVDWVQELVSPTPAYTATGTNRLMNPITGTVFRDEPQSGCRAAGTCYDPNHGTAANGGTRLVPYDPNLRAALQQQSTSRGSGSGSQQQPTTQLLASVTVPGCNNGWSETVNIPAGHQLFWAWQAEIARVQYRGPSSTGWINQVPADGIVTDVRFCVNSGRSGTYVYHNDRMGLTWQRT